MLIDSFFFLFLKLFPIKHATDYLRSLSQAGTRKSLITRSPSSPDSGSLDAHVWVLLSRLKLPLNSWDLRTVTDSRLFSSFSFTGERCDSSWTKYVRRCSETSGLGLNALGCLPEHADGTWVGRAAPEIDVIEVSSSLHVSSSQPRSPSLR